MIDFNKPYITEDDYNYIHDALMSKKVCGDGKYTKLVTQWFFDQGVGNLLLTTSGSSALDMSAILSGLQPEDEVILPSYTFVSTANAFLLQNAKIVFAEVDPRTMNIDLEDVKRKITSKTKVICPVHYAGTSCDMDELSNIAKESNAKIIEDAAQGVGSTYKGMPLGTIGDFGCYSFHETKNYAMGEGGAIISKNKEDYTRAEIIREKGTDRSLFMRGEVDKYTWRDIGSSFLPSELPVALLYSQLMKFEEIMNLRMNIWNKYHDAFKNLEEQGKVIRPFIPEYNKHNAHMYYLILPTGDMRDKILKYLKENGIQAVFHYIPLHSSPMGQKLGYKVEDLPITEEYSKRLLRLPMYAGLEEEKVGFIIDKIYDFFKEV